MQTITISDGRTVNLVNDWGNASGEVDAMSHDVAMVFATTIADFLVRSGQMNTDAPVTPTTLVQFLSEAADWLSTPQTNFVVNVTYDCAGPSETLGVFRSMEEAAGDIVRRIVESATAKGVVVTDVQRETLATSVILGTGFSGHAKPTGRTDEVALQPIREALGWVDYDISDVPTGTAEPVSTDRVVLKGRAEIFSSRRGMKYVEIMLSEPYDHSVRFVVNAKPGQDDDDLAIALAILDVPVTVNALRTDDGFECTTDDITRLRP